MRLLPLRSLTLALAGMGALSPLACTHQQGDSHTVGEPVPPAGGSVAVHHPAPQDDKPYWQALQAATREHKVYSNFETQYFVRATYLSPQFSSAFHTRYKHLYKQSQPLFEEAQKKSAFFVSIFAPVPRKTDLDDQSLWTIFMKLGGSRYAPTHVRHLSRKEQWYPFFPYVDLWTKEYFVIFDAPAITPHAPEMVRQTGLELTFSNAEAQVVMSW